MNQHQTSQTPEKASGTYYLYTRDGCCLCEQAEALLTQHWPELWTKLVIVNLSRLDSPSNLDDPHLTQQHIQQHAQQHKESLIVHYGHHVPVLVHRPDQYNQYDQKNQCYQHSEEWLFDCQTSAEEIQTLRLKYRLI